MSYILVAGLPFVLSMIVTAILAQKMERYIQKKYPKIWLDVYQYRNKFIANIPGYMGQEVSSIERGYYYNFKNIIHYFKFLFSNKYSNIKGIKKYKNILRTCWIFTFSFLILFPVFAIVFFT